MDCTHRSTDCESADVGVLQDLLHTTEKHHTTQVTSVSTVKAREVLNMAHAIAVIVPWSIQPVVPAHLASALGSILEPYYKTKEHTVRVLQRKLSKLKNKTYWPSGWNEKEITELIDQVAGDKQQFFANSSQSFIYHEAMSLVFKHRGIGMEDVRFRLAGSVAAGSLRFRTALTESERFQQKMMQYLERCYLEPMPAKSLNNVPDWALDVYGMLRFTWSNDSG